MLYLLDSNVLIDANRDYYPLDRVKPFWSWLIEMGNRGLIKIPPEMFDEVGAGTDQLANWIKLEEVKQALLLQESFSSIILNRVLDDGYGRELNDVEIQMIGKDPYLISYALNDLNNRCVVTTESSKPNRQRENKKIPDVCKTFGICCIHTYAMIRALDFSTDWKEK